MVGTGESVASVAERLGIKPKKVRTLADAAATTQPLPREDADGPSGGGEGSQDELAESARQGEGFLVYPRASADATRLGSQAVHIRRTRC